MANGVKTFTDTGSGDFGERYDANDYTDGMLCAIYTGLYYGTERYFMLHAAPVSGSTWGYALNLHSGRRWLDGTTYLVDGMYFHNANAAGEVSFPTTQAISAFEPFDTYENALYALTHYSPIVSYPITYHYTNSTVSGPAEAAVGDTVTVSAVPDVGYGITDASTQIIVTNNDIAVPYTWDAVNQRITFTMPDPS